MASLLSKEDVIRLKKHSYFITVDPDKSDEKLKELTKTKPEKV